MWFRSIFNGKTRAGQPPVGAVSPAGSGPLSSRTVRQLNRLSLNTRPLLPAQSGGSRSSPMRRPATEFREHRPYAPGDDVRYVDWKASARQEHIFIKQGDYQKAAFVYILLDCSASMAWGDPPKSRAALTLANALGYLALAHNDRLMVLPVAGSPAAGDRQGGPARPLLGPLWGKGQLALLSRSIQAVRFQGQADLAQSLRTLGQRKRSRGGLVLVISDLFGINDLSSSLEALPTPAWKVVLCHLLHPDEISPALHGHFEMQDIETGQKKLYPVTAKILETYRQRLQSWQADIARVCQERKAVYTMFPTHASFEQDMIPQLLRSQVVSRL